MENLPNFKVGLDYVYLLIVCEKQPLLQCILRYYSHYQHDQICFGHISHGPPADNHN